MRSGRSGDLKKATNNKTHTNTGGVFVITNLIIIISNKLIKIITKKLFKNNKIKVNDNVFVN